MSTAKPKQNPALRLLGIPMLPKKLPSRNWLIFWGITGSFTAAIVYDRREKRKATARWASVVAPLSKELIPNASAMPRKVTVFLEAPPGDGLRPAQDHFKEYVKPILASSGLDWEFVVGRRQGDVRAVVAERVRRARRAVEPEVYGGDAATDQDVIEDLRIRNGIHEYEGVKGDLILGRHTWKEYVRGLHEGWLGPVTPPEPPAALEAPPKDNAEATSPEGSGSTGAKPAEEKPAEEKPTTPPAEEKPKEPTQPQPYNTPDQYPSSALPRFVPAELSPSVAVPFPHILGFLNTPTRLYRFLNRRRLADDVGREVASVCFCTYREYQESMDGYEQEEVLKHEEKNWPKTVWKVEDPKKEAAKAAAAAAAEDELPKPPAPPAERIWASPMVIDPRIASRMRRFEIDPAVEQKAKSIVVSEEEVEGWIKGKLRMLGRWAGHQWTGDKKTINIGNLDDE